MEILEKVNEAFHHNNSDNLPSTALFLVGTNPLPVYVAAKALRPNKIFLLGTTSVTPIMECLEKCIKNETNANIISATCNPANSIDIRKQTANLLLKQTDKQVWLFYTAGTKAMAVHSHEEWKKYVGEKHYHWAAYLSSDGPRLWFDNITVSFPLHINDRYSVPQLNLDEIFRIHQIDRKKPFKDFHIKDQYFQMAEQIHANVITPTGNKIIKYLELLPPTYDNNITIPVNDDKLKTADNISFMNKANFADNSLHSKFSLNEWEKSIGIVTQQHSLETIDDVAQWLTKEDRPSKGKDRKELRLNILKWIATKWLETWVAKNLADVEMNLFHEVHESVEYLIPVESTSELNSEVDVCGIRGHTPFIFSCTVDHKQSGKHKLFEVRLRANQLGGEHARAAVVCLADTPKNIENELNQGWAGYGTVKVFGFQDIMNQEIFKQSVKNWIDELEKEQGVN
jgi:hypothetical protein